MKRLSLRSVDAAFALATLLVVVGFLLLALGWYGSARTFFIPAQFAYGLSGSLAGLCVLALGLTVFTVQVGRRAAARRSQLQLQLLGDVRSLAALLASADRDGADA